MAKKRKKRPAKRQPTTRASKPAAKASSTPPLATKTAQRSAFPAAKVRPSRRERAATKVDFIHEYAYVYYDLKKMVALAVGLFVLMILLNIVV